jgi:hypothetical protein
MPSSVDVGMWCEPIMLSAPFPSFSAPFPVFCALFLPSVLHHDPARSGLDDEQTSRCGTSCAVFVVGFFFVEGGGVILFQCVSLMVHSWNCDNL